ncbi:hypothetical protein [Sporisorium scitamineum]|uniref:Uncharacterized protein n=1 Tax=Sporisorium scitamineum TaxID=49012 RepID=A0A0F7S9E0_9BASI|nr:hypothetical protein [Sporisorium scitamineum]
MSASSRAGQTGNVETGKPRLGLRSSAVPAVQGILDKLTLRIPETG